MFCRKCQSWELFDSDLFCGWCGDRLIDILLSFDNDYVYIGDPTSDCKLTITHAGTIGTIHLTSATSDKSWLRVKDNQNEILSSTYLRSGESVEITLEVDGTDLPNDYNPAKVTIQSSVGWREAKFEAVPKPKLDKLSITGEHTILLDDLPEERLTGYLAISNGLVTIEDVRTDAEWAQVFPTNQSIPCRLDARNNKRLEFEFKIDEMRLLKEIKNDGGTFPAERRANLLMTFARLESQRRYPFFLNCLLPPELLVPEGDSTIEVKAFIGKRAEFNLTLQNGIQGAEGHADLQILNIEPDSRWLQPTMSISYPLTIVSGEYQHVTFAVSAENLELGNRHVKVTLHTNIPGPKKQKDVFIEVDVHQMPTFEGALAIDFGTTNSCCAFIDQRGRQELIPIDSEGNSKATTSSAILYKNLLDDGSKDYEIGSRAYNFSFSGGIFARCTVKQVKRWLGKQKQFEIRFQDDPEKAASYTAREVASDILQRILQQAEARLNARITTCTISHPCRFQVRQIDDLKAALVACGINEGGIRLVPEPVGAALDFIRGEEVRTKFEQYHLMVFDFGGGTIDVTLMKVVNEKRPGRNLMYVNPDVLGIAGDNHFGGEDVTEAVLELMHTNCERELQARNQSAGTCLIPIKEEPFKDARYKVFARLNRAQLRQRAEATKIAIASYGNDYLERLDEILQSRSFAGQQDAIADASAVRTILSDKFTLAAIIDNRIDEIYNFAHQSVAPRKEQIDAALLPKLTEIVESMKRLAAKREIAAPEIILLSGKSSSFPIVREVVSKGFPDSRIEMALNLKECVVLGASQIADESPREGVAVRVGRGHSLNAMTSSLGISITGLHGSRFRTVIENGEPIGREGISKVIERDVEFTRRTRITIYENTGSSDNLFDSSGKDNPNITALKTFRLESKLSQWERENDDVISELDLENAVIKIEVGSNLKVKLIAKIPRIDQSFEFEAEYLGG